MRWNLTFDLQADLVVGGSQDAARHTRVRAFVLGAGAFDLQGAVDVNAVLTSVQTAALTVLEPARSHRTTYIFRRQHSLRQHTCEDAQTNLTSAAPAKENRRKDSPGRFCCSRSL